MLENGGDVCFEEEVEQMRRSGMSTDEIAQQMGVDRIWVDSIVSMVDQDSSEAGSERN
jgi:predicted regulator of amino acid metabolism with ACT domain